VSLPAGVFTAAGAGVKTNLLFFTKGGPTRKIWYYDLTDVKVRKKTPLTLDHFVDLFRLLPERADSELSWTVDIDERKRAATEEARPFKDEATAKKQQTTRWNDRLKELKKAKPKNETAIAEAEEKVKLFGREAKEAEKKAKQIEDAVYDLKAVNPNKKPKIDTRTPEELLDIIEAKGQEVAEALAILRASLDKQKSSAG